MKTFLFGGERAKRIAGFGGVFGRSVGRWEDNSIMGSKKKTDWKDVDWTKLVEGRNKWRVAVNKVMKMPVL